MKILVIFFLRSLHRILFVFRLKEKNCATAPDLDTPIIIRRTLKAYKSIRHAEQTKEQEQRIPSSGDVGVYELTEDVPFYKEIYPACLADYKTDISDEFDYYGFGSDGANAPDHLRHTKMNSVKCDIEGTPAELQDLFCVYKKYQKLCKGDSGGGLIHTRHDTKSVIAVGSFIAGFCHEKKEIDVYGEDGRNDYLADIRPHLYWICEATGVCANKEIEADVALWSSLPNRHRERFVTFSAKDEFDIFT